MQSLSSAAARCEPEASQEAPEAVPAPAGEADPAQGGPAPGPMAGSVGPDPFCPDCRSSCVVVVTRDRGTEQGDHVRRIRRCTNCGRGWSVDTESDAV